MDELATTNELERTFPPKTIQDQFPHHQSLAPRRLHTGLAKGEQITGAGILAEDSFLILGTLGGQVKRVKGKDVQSAAEASWDTIIGLAGKGAVRVLHCHPNRRPKRNRDGSFVGTLR